MSRKIATRLNAIARELSALGFVETCDAIRKHTTPRDWRERDYNRDHAAEERAIGRLAIERSGDATLRPLAIKIAALSASNERGCLHPGSVLSIIGHRYTAHTIDAIHLFNAAKGTAYAQRAIPPIHDGNMTYIEGPSHQVAAAEAEAMLRDGWMP